MYYTMTGDKYYCYNGTVIKQNGKTDIDTLSIALAKPADYTLSFFRMKIN